MPGFGGFYKGEKKKQKKGKEVKNVSSSSPTFALPVIITKKKKEQF